MSRRLRVRGGLAWVVACAALVLSSTASATTFSWGTINPGDNIDKIIFASGATANYDLGTDLLTIDGSLSTITFTNRGSISGISGVNFSSQVTLDEIATFILATDPFPPFFPAGLPIFVDAVFQGTSFSVIDTNGPSDVDLLGGGFGPGGVSVTAQEIGGGFVVGDVSAGLTGLTGADADFLAAFSDHGTINGALTYTGLGTTLCDLMVDCTDLSIKGFSTNAVMSLTHAPEPNTFTLVMLGLTGFGVVRRNRR